MSLAVKPVHSKRPFVAVPYRLDAATGRWLPVMPATCPDAALVAGIPCRVRLSGWRRRKCGPEHPLAVGACRSHRRWFTLYPPAWTPFARKPLFDLTPAGDLIISERQWSHTLFQALIDAADGQPWPIEARFSTDDRSSTSRGTRKTQLRHIHGAMRLLALEETDEHEQLAVAVALGVDLTMLVLAASRIRDGPSTAVRAEEGAEILRKASRPRSRLLLELVDRGHACQFWGSTHATQTSHASAFPTVTFVP